MGLRETAALLEEVEALMAVENENLLKELLRIAMLSGFSPEETGEILIQSENPLIKKAGEFLMKNLITEEDETAA